MHTKGTIMKKSHENKRLLQTIKFNNYEQSSYRSRLSMVKSANDVVLAMFGPLLHSINIPTVDLLDYETMHFVGYPKHKALRRTKRKTRCNK